jgi:hypothetical protein
MDTGRFDAATRVIGRRGLLSAAVVLSGLALASTPDAAADLVACGLQKGDRCQRDNECCSGRCRRTNNRRTGRCRCSKLRKPCFDNLDCCGVTTGTSGSVVCSQPSSGGSKIVCCVSLTGPCETTADCCSDLECRGNTCSSL